MLQLNKRNIAQNNGRMGRILMNAMFAAGGYPWTIVSIDKRGTYMLAPEKASEHKNISPFIELLSGLVTAELKGNTIPKLPSE